MFDAVDVIAAAKLHLQGKRCKNCPYNKFHSGCEAQLIEDMLDIITLRKDEEDESGR